MTRLNHLLRRSRAAIDLVSIMVGVIVVSIVAGAIGTTVFAVIPWTQNQAAAQVLTEVVKAERAAKLPDSSQPLTGKYLSSADMKTVGLFDAPAGVKIATDTPGTCFVAVSKSAAGRVFWVSSDDPAPRLYLDETSSCADLPGMVTAAGTSVGLGTWRNDFTNPSFDSVVAGSNVFRKNLFTNPTPTATTAGYETYTPTAGITTSARVAESGAVGSSFYRVKFNAASAAGGALVRPVNVSVGLTYTVSAYVRLNRATPVSVNIEWFNASSSKVSAVYGAPTTPTAGKWGRAFATGVAPAGAATATVAFYSSGGSWASGDTEDVDGVLFEQADQLRPYFGGNTPDSFGWDYGWAGVANSSVSTAKAATTTVHQNLEPNPSGEVLPIDTAGAGNGVRTLDTTRKIAGTSSTKFVWTGAAWGAETSNIPVEPDTTYTVSVWMYSESGKLPQWSVADMYNEPVYLFSAATAGEWSRVSVTFTTSPTQLTMKAWAVIDSPGTFYVDAILVEKSNTVGTYFDGSTGSRSDFIYGWTGAQNDSISTQTGVKVDGAAGYFGSYSVRLLSWERARYGDTSMRVIQTAIAPTTTGWEVGGFNGNVEQGSVATARQSLYVPDGMTVSSTFRTVNGGAHKWLTIDGGNNWTDYSAQSDPRAGSSYVYGVQAFTPTNLVGGEFWVDGAQFIVGTPPGGYFDGSTLGSTETRFGWDGVPGQSSSTVSTY